MSFFNQHIKHDTCVCCGGYVPEGRQVCITCEKKSEEPGGADNEPKKICLLCAYWNPNGDFISIIRHGADCLMSGKKSEMNKTCWGWGIASPNQLDERKNAGLFEEVKGNE